MKKFMATMTYMYGYIECEIEAKNKAEAKEIFIEELTANEGEAYTNRALTFGKMEIEEI